MKYPKEIKDRINQLTRALKHGIDTSMEISILESAILLSEEQIKVTLKNQVDMEKYKEASISIWILKDGINI